jgi:hypothetical protein
MKDDEDRANPPRPNAKPSSAQLADAGRRAAERVETAWWREPLRVVLATGDQGLIDDFVKLFKAVEARRFKSG